jgi:hypothetical protein
MKLALKEAQEIPKNLNKLESLKRQLQFVIFNDYKNRTHDKRRDFLINTVWLLVHSLAPFFAKKKSTVGFNYGH